MTEHFKPDTNLLNGIVLEYLSPFQDSCDQLLSALEGPWESASAETSGDDASSASDTQANRTVVGSDKDTKVRMGERDGRMKGRAK